MSVESEAGEMMSRCASCGIAGGDDVELKRCNGCYLVRYCSVKCQKEHRPKHKKYCKKRAAELRDELLFKQPENSCYGDCPICLIPLPLDLSKSIIMTCCSKMICDGCNFANRKREIEMRLEKTCPFCRQPPPKTDEEGERMKMKRVEANDPDALTYVGTQHREKGDDKSAVEYWTKAAELGDIVAHYQLSCMYGLGEGVEKDEKKERYYLEHAAIGGHPQARHSLGVLEWANCRFDRAINHWIIAANLGDDNSMKRVKNIYQGGCGFISKDDFASTLRAHHAAVNAMKSPQRKAAADMESRGYFVIPQRDS